MTAPAPGTPRPDVLLLLRSLAFGGTERQVALLGRGLLARGRRVRIVTFYPGGGIEGEVQAAGVPLESLGKGSRYDVIPFLLRLLRLLRRERPRVLYTFLPVANLLGVALRPLLPSVRLVLGVRASGMDLARYDRLSGLSYLLERRLARFADRVIVNSAAGREEALRNGFPAHRLVTIRNGIDTERFRPDPAARLRVRGELGVGEGEPLIGLVARLDPMKDHETFLRAAARLAPSRPEARFACVGDGPEPERARLARLGAELGLGDRLVWRPAYRDPAPVHAALDIATSSSAFGEGFSNTVAEAMACGVPAAVTDVGDSALVVGDTGAVVPRRDPEALAEAWRRLLDADGARLGTRARQRIVREFGVERLLDETERVLWG